VVSLVRLGMSFILCHLTELHAESRENGRGERENPLGKNRRIDATEHETTARQEPDRSVRDR